MLPERFYNKVEKTPSGCWLWKGCKSHNGYGLFEFKTTRGWCVKRAHRLVFEDLHGPVVGQVLHHCDNPGCVNIEHLFTGTASDNVRDKVQKKRQARHASHGCAKLTEAAVRDIRAAYTSKNVKTLADKYHVDRTTIWLVAAGRTWR